MPDPRTRPRRSHSTPPVTAEGEAFRSDPTRLRHAAIPAPSRGSVSRAASGVLWGRIPLPIDLSRINVWLLDAPGGCIAVDTGMAVSMGKDAWEAIGAEVFADKPLRGVFVTHVHADHMGLAAWLQKRYGAPVTMSRRTFEQASLMLEGPTQAVLAQAERFFARHGLGDDAAHLLPMFRPERSSRMTSGLPEVERFVADEEDLYCAPGWKALQTDGHAEGHLCLWNESAGVLISGDQVLPSISSNVSYGWRTLDPDPLGSYLESLRRLRRLPEDTLVLPAHGLPFYGLQQRIDDLLSHHEEQLERVLALCERPRPAAELLSHLFRIKLKGVHLFLALGETVAHLEHLVLRGRMERFESAGVVHYAASAAQ